MDRDDLGRISITILAALLLLTPPQPGAPLPSTPMMPLADPFPLQAPVLEAPLPFAPPSLVVAPLLITSPLSLLAASWLQAAPLPVAPSSSPIAEGLLLAVPLPVVASTSPIAGTLLRVLALPVPEAPHVSGSAERSLPTGAGNTLDEIDHAYASLLSRYVTRRGVRYTAWRSSPADIRALSDVVQRLASVNPETVSPAERHALFINLYNAKVLELVLAERPTRSIKEITPGVTGFGVFLKPVLEIQGQKMSLRQLEDRLRQESKDPRIHFAINCASRSCPPISVEPYRGSSLDAQLDRATRSFLASPGAVVVKRGKNLLGKDTVTIETSKIFDWYEKDFRWTGGSLAFIQKYGPPAVAEAIRGAKGSAKTSYQDYDWSLNAAP